MRILKPFSVVFLSLFTLISASAKVQFVPTDTAGLYKSYFKLVEGLNKWDAYKLKTSVQVKNKLYSDLTPCDTNTLYLEGILVCKGGNTYAFLEGQNVWFIKANENNFIQRICQDSLSTELFGVSNKKLSKIVPINYLIPNIQDPLELYSFNSISRDYELYKFESNQYKSEVVFRGDAFNHHFNKSWSCYTTTNGVQFHLQQKSGFNRFKEPFIFNYSFSISPIVHFNLDSFIHSITLKADSLSSTKSDKLEQSNKIDISRVVPENMTFMDALNDTVYFRKFLNESIGTMDSKRFHLDSINTKFLFLDFWYMSCAPCLESIPEVAEIVHELKNYPDISFISYNLYDDAEKLKSFCGRMKMDDKHIVMGKDGKVAYRYGINEAPIFLILDLESDKLIYFKKGYSKGQLKEELIGTVKKLHE